MSESIAIKVKLFGAFQEIAGDGEFERNVAPGTTIDDLWGALASEWPGLSERDPVRLNAVNLDFAEGDRRLDAGDEVAFFPPVSGG